MAIPPKENVAVVYLATLQADFVVLSFEFELGFLDYRRVATKGIPFSSLDGGKEEVCFLLEITDRMSQSGEKVG